MNYCLYMNSRSQARRYVSDFDTAVVTFLCRGVLHCLLGRLCREQPWSLRGTLPANGVPGARYPLLGMCTKTLSGGVAAPAAKSHWSCAQSLCNALMCRTASRPLGIERFPGVGPAGRALVTFPFFSPRWNVILSLVFEWHCFCSPKYSKTFTTS